MTATDDAAYHALAIGGSVSSAAAGTVSGTALAGAAAGAYASNVVDTVVRATISAASTVRSLLGAIKLLASFLVSLLRADAFGVAVAFAASRRPNSTTGALAIGVGIAINDIDRTVEASIDESTVEAHNDLTLDSSAHGNVSTLGVGVAVSVARGTGGTGSIAGAGSAAVNRIDGTIASSISDSGGARHVTSSDGSVRLSATDSADIVGVAGTIALALGMKNGGSGATAAVAVGVSVVINEIGLNGGQSTKATIDESIVTAHGDVSLTATSEASIYALAAGGSGAVAGSSSGTGVTGAFAGAGVGTSNTVKQTIAATVTDSTITATTGVARLHAVDGTQITADAGAVAVAVALSTGNGTVLSGSIGVAVALNTVEDDVWAYVDGSTVTAASVDIKAEAKKAPSSPAAFQIDALALTVSAAVAGSTQTTAVGLAGAGAAAVNTIQNTIHASIRNDSTVTVTGAAGLTLTASDASTIHSDAIGAAFTAAGANGGNAGAIAVGISVAINKVNNDVLAAIDHSTVTANTGSVTLTASEDANIHSLSVAASLSAALSSSTALAIAGGGAASINSILSRANATIASSTVTATVGAVTVQSDSDSVIDAMVVSIAAAIAVGSSNAPAIAIGVAVARNFIGYDEFGNVVTDSEGTPYTSEIRATIDNSTVTAGGALSATATAHQTIDALVVAASVAVGVGGKNGFSLAGSGVFAENTIAADVQASVSNDTAGGIHAGSVALSASNTSDIDATAAAASLAVAVGGSNAVAISIGVALAHNTITGDVEASVVGVDDLLTTSGGVSIHSTDSSSIHAIAAAASLAAGFSSSTGIAVSGAGAESTNIILTTTRAFVANSHVNSAAGVDLQASSTGVVDATIVAASVAAAGGGSTAVGASIGVAVARNFIGWQPDGGTTFTYSSTERPATLVSTNRVKIVSGPRNGDVYEYTGSTLSGAAFDYPDFKGSQPTVVSGGIVAGTRVKRTSDGKVFRYAPAYDFVSSATLTNGLTPGKRVLHAGRVYTYAGPGLAGTVDLSTQAYPSGSWVLVPPPSDLSAEDYTVITKWAPVPDGVELETLDYSDVTVWKRIGVDRTAVVVEAKIENSGVDAAAGALTLSATSTQKISAIVIAGSAAISGGGSTGVAASGAGAYAENRIATEVRALIDGDGTTEIDAASLSATASDASQIKALAGAASIAGTVGGSIGVAVSIGLSIAINQVDNDVEAFVKDVHLTTTTGGVTLSATTAAVPPFSTSAVTAAQLDNLAKSDDTVADWNGDATIRQTISTAFAANSITLPTTDLISTAALYTTADGTKSLKTGDLVRDLATGNAYRFLGANDTSVNLGTVVFTGATWVLERPIRVSTLVAGSAWTLVAGDGTTYDLRRLPNGDISISRATISVVSAAASLAVGIGGTTGVAVAGAGAIAINSVTGVTNAYIENSTIDSAGAVSITSSSASGISATVVAVAVSIGGGGNVGVGVAIGISVARNFIGAGLDGTADPLEIKAYTTNSSISSGGALTITATASQAISAMVFAGAAAIAVGANAGVGVAGSGVFAENVIRAHVKAEINGDGANGISATSILVKATDQSKITAVAGAAALAAAFAGVGAAVAVSIGVSLARNTIANQVEAKIVNANGPSHTSEETAADLSTGDRAREVTTNRIYAYGGDDDDDVDLTTPGIFTGSDWVEVLTGPVTVEAREAASIDAISAAASVAVAAAFVGVAVSGAGAWASNTILTRTNAHIDNSILRSTGAVSISATDASSIKALIAALSLAVGGGAVGVGASIGLALAENQIGWNPDDTAVAHHVYGENVLTLHTGDRVKISEGIRAGHVYRYLGPDLTIAENYNASGSGTVTRGERVAHDGQIYELLADTSVSQRRPRERGLLGHHEVAARHRPRPGLRRPVPVAARRPDLGGGPGPRLRARLQHLRRSCADNHRERDGHDRRDRHLRLGRDLRRPRRRLAQRRRRRSDEPDHDGRAGVHRRRRPVRDQRRLDHDHGDGWLRDQRDRRGRLDRCRLRRRRRRAVDRGRGREQRGRQPRQRHDRRRGHGRHRAHRRRRGLRHDGRPLRLQPDRHHRRPARQRRERRSGRPGHDRLRQRRGRERPRGRHHDAHDPRERLLGAQRGAGDDQHRRDVLEVHDRGAEQERDARPPGSRHRRPRPAREELRERWRRRLRLPLQGRRRQRRQPLDSRTTTPRARGRRSPSCRRCRSCRRARSGSSSRPTAPPTCCPRTLPARSRSSARRSTSSPPRPRSPSASGSSAWP